MKLRKFIPIALCAVLAACGNTHVKETLGLNRTAPDEFQVYSRPPLSVPPEFNLRPPTDGSEYAVGGPADDKAHNKILGTPDAASQTPPAPGSVQFLNSATTGPAPTAVPAVTANSLPSGADSQFLSNAGASKADPNIRQTLQQSIQSAAPPKDDTYFFGGSKPTDSEVDATKEADRLKQDKAQNKPPTTGETPVVAPQDHGILGNLF
jgi:hypothetical protein